MNVVFFSPVIDQQVENTAGVMTGALESIPAFFGLEIHRTIDSLWQRIRQPLNGIGLVLLNILRREDLSGLMPIKERLRDLRVIFIISDTDQKILRDVHLFRPRFIVQASEAPDVLWKICRRVLSRSSARAFPDRGMDGSRHFPGLSNPLHAFKDHV